MAAQAAAESYVWLANAFEAFADVANVKQGDAITIYTWPGSLAWSQWAADDSPGQYLLLDVKARRHRRAVQVGHHADADLLPLL